MPPTPNNATLSPRQTSQTRQTQSQTPPHQTTNRHTLRIRLSHQQTRRQHPLPHLTNQHPNRSLNTQSLHRRNKHTKPRQGRQNRRRPKPFPQTLPDVQIPRHQLAKNISQLNKPRTSRPQPPYKIPNRPRNPQTHHQNHHTIQPHL